jgi:uncharacterized protein (TIGR02145 family)
MISEINIPIRRPVNSYYLRWYYNGWHYWSFLPGKESIEMSGQLYNTISKKTRGISSGPVNSAQAISLRTITCSKEVQLYTSDGWMQTFISPGTFEIRNNYFNGFEIELSITIGSREISKTGYSPVIILPEPLPKTPLYGLLYNWYAVSNSNGLAPAGWHIPTNAEINTLLTYITSNKGGAVKETGYTHWAEPNTGATNNTGLTLLGGGQRGELSSSGVFSYFKQVSLLGINASYDASLWYGIEAYYNASSFIKSYIFKESAGTSIRCIKDDPDDWTEGDTMTDYDGNTYSTVKIGTQVWTVENLAVTHYRNGLVIPEVTDNTAWAALTTGALCAYNNDWTDVFKS